MNKPGSTSFAPLSEQPPSKEEREQAEAIQKQELEKSRIDQLTEKLSSILAKLDIEKDGEKIQQTLERAFAIADDPAAPQGIQQAASWKLKEQEETRAHQQTSGNPRCRCFTAQSGKRKRTKFGTKQTNSGKICFKQ